MAKTLLILAAISAALYLILAVLSWRKHKNAGKQIPENCTKQNPAYVWGFVFALIFYYGFPIWWWRYGFQNACKLIFSCIAIAAAIQGVLRYLDVIEVSEWTNGEGLDVCVGQKLLAISHGELQAILVLCNTPHPRV
jgi:hypothetical protein